MQIVFSSKPYRWLHKSGVVFDLQQFTALVTNSGLAQLTSALTGSGMGAVWLAIGTGAGTVAATDTAMFTEDTTTGRTSTTISRVTTNVANDTIQFVATVSFPSINETLTNVGLFTASTSGTMYYHRDGVNTVVGPTNGTTSVTFTEDIVF